MELFDHAGQSIVAMGLRCVPDGSEPYSINIGRILVYRTPQTPPEPPSDLQVLSENVIDSNNATLRLSWTASPSAVNTYAVFQRHSDGSETWLGGTPNTAYFVQSLTRDGSEATSTIEVETISPDFQYSTAATTTVTWDSIFADGFDTTGP